MLSATRKATEFAATRASGFAESCDYLHRAEQERLYPRITNPNWLVLRRRREIFRTWLHEIATTGLTVLDVGARIQPYRQLIPADDVRYVSVDLHRTALVDVTAAAEQLPISDASIDITLCTQMLEYALEPDAVIAEIWRVLRPYGYLLLSVPSLALRDADGDCWRFWPAALRHLLSAFSEVKIVPEVSSVAGLFRTVNVAITSLAKYPAARAIATSTIVPALNLLGMVLETCLQTETDVMAVNYSVLARK